MTGAAPWQTRPSRASPRGTRPRAEVRAGGPLGWAPGHRRAAGDRARVACGELAAGVAGRDRPDPVRGLQPVRPRVDAAWALGAIPRASVLSIATAWLTTSCWLAVTPSAGRWRWRSGFDTNYHYLDARARGRSALCAPGPSTGPARSPRRRGLGSRPPGGPRTAQLPAAEQGRRASDRAARSRARSPASSRRRSTRCAAPPPGSRSACSTATTCGPPTSIGRSSRSTRRSPRSPALPARIGADERRHGP